MRIIPETSRLPSDHVFYCYCGTQEQYPGVAGETRDNYLFVWAFFVLRQRRLRLVGQVFRGRPTSSVVVMTVPELQFMHIQAPSGTRRPGSPGDQVCGQFEAPPRHSRRVGLDIV